MSSSQTAPKSHGLFSAGGVAVSRCCCSAWALAADALELRSAGRPSTRRLRTFSTTCCEVITSQMPSHASTTNSSLSESRASTMTSGNAVTACAFRSTVSHRLYTKSPSARETARSPLTRLNLTVPPAASIRAFSSGLYGLWSSDSGTACPARQSTARESPVFAQTMCFGEMSVMTDVDPDWSWPDSTSGCCRSSASIDISAVSNALVAVVAKSASEPRSVPARERCSGNLRAT
mmetsp:Transcript_43400/g.143586  ORF Transcript_43400/g.143586 Transcript_43400/m.143586 type:complete len:234 (+) Transcript_43400:787-1488(+)